MPPTGEATRGSNWVTTDTRGEEALLRPPTGEDYMMLQTQQPSEPRAATEG